jgi:hypothetical protein
LFDAAVGGLCALVRRFAANVGIHAVSIRPIGFDRNGMKTPLRDETPGDLGSMPVEFVRPMRSFSNQNEVSFSDCLQ